MGQVMVTLFPHHLGHYLGLDTHDTITMLVERNQQLTPGMVVTMESQGSTYHWTAGICC